MKITKASKRHNLDSSIKIDGVDASNVDRGAVVYAIRKACKAAVEDNLWELEDLLSSILGYVDPLYHEVENGTNTEHFEFHGRGKVER